MALDEAVTGLKTVSTFLRKMKDALSVEKYNALALQQCKLWSGKLSSMDLADVETCSKLMDTIQIGAWEADLKEHLLEALAKRSADGAAGNTKSPLRARQTLRNFGAYMTSGDCDRMRDSTVGISKLDVLASRMQRIGLRNPAETTYGLIIGPLGILSQQFPSST